MTDRPDDLMTEVNKNTKLILILLASGVLILLSLRAASDWWEQKKLEQLDSIHEIPEVDETPASAPAFHPFDATLFCADCGERINIWQTADRAGLITEGSVPNNSRVYVTDNAIYDGVLQFRISVTDSTVNPERKISGWVSSDLVQPIN